MNIYSFQLGREPELSTAEIKAVFSALGKKSDFKIKEQYLILEVKDELDTQNLMKTLGGTIKISKKIDNTLKQHISEHQPDGKIQFSLNNKKEALDLKKELKADGRSVRYIEPKNTATILHNNLVEKHGDYTLIGKDVFVTEAIQPIEELSERDYGRPGSDDKSGMLPPKLSKMMINLAEQKKDEVLLDPFCGSGTVLMEAAVIGYTNLLGSDISPKAVQDTKKNLDWISENYKLQDTNYKVSVRDARQIHKALKPNSISAIITEPYLGKPLRGNEDKSFLETQAAELGELYVRAFDSFAKVMKKDGSIVISIPSFRYKKDWILIDCIEAIKKAGFKQVELLPGKNFLRYHRAKQHVARDIWRFKKN